METAANVFLDNKYSKWYFNIITSRLQKGDEGSLTETHHVVPECFFKRTTRRHQSPSPIDGDPNAETNLVALTLREHILCHALLPKMTTGELQRKMIWSYNMMSNFGRLLHILRRDSLFS